MVEAYQWTPAECKQLTIRERRYWIAYLDYKRKAEQYRKMMTTPQQFQFGSR